MQVKVDLYVAGKVFSEIVEAANYQDAKETAKARNPKAKIVGCTAVFKWEPIKIRSIGTVPLV